LLIEWSVWALADRDAIFDYIEAESPKTAAAVDGRIEKQVKALAMFPEMGRAGRVEQTRELVIKRTPFIVAYRIEGGSVRILRVLRGAQEWPENMPGQV
jgi:toxin ParE1/3/4